MEHKLASRRLALGAVDVYQYEDLGHVGIKFGREGLYAMMNVPLVNIGVRA